MGEKNLNNQINQHLTNEEVNTAINSLEKDYGFIFEKEKILGKGAEGTVYLVKLKNGKEAAVKIPNSFKTFDYNQNRNKINILLNTANGGVTKTLKTIPLIFGEKILPVEVMKVMENSLDKLCISRKNKELINYDEFNFTPFSIFADSLAGLKTIHNTGIIHADLKPMNIFINENGTAKIGDIGSSNTIGYFKKIKDIVSQPGSLVCKAPELFTDEYEYSITEKSDIYALGITMLEIFSGKNIIDILIEQKFEVKKKQPYKIPFRIINKKEAPQMRDEYLDLSRLLTVDVNDIPENIKKEIKEKIVTLINGMTNYDMDERFDLNTIEIKLKELFDYLKANGIDLRTNLKLKNKTLYRLNYSDEAIIQEEIEKFRVKIDSLLNYDKNLKDNDFYFLTKLGDEIDNFSPESIQILKLINEKLIQLDKINEEDYKETLDILKSKIKDDKYFREFCLMKNLINNFNHIYIQYKELVLKQFDVVDTIETQEQNQESLSTEENEIMNSEDSNIIQNEQNDNAEIQNSIDNNNEIQEEYFEEEELEYSIDALNFHLPSLIQDNFVKQMSSSDLGIDNLNVNLNEEDNLNDDMSKQNNEEDIQIQNNNENTILPQLTDNLQNNKSKKLKKKTQTKKSKKSTNSKTNINLRSKVYKLMIKNFIRADKLEKKKIRKKCNLSRRVPRVYLDWIMKHNQKTNGSIRNY